MTKRENCSRKVGVNFVSINFLGLSLFMYYTIIGWLQIITESLPISSSGHVQLITHMLYGQQPDTAWYHFFDYALHIPTALVLALFFCQPLISLLINVKRTWPYIVRIFVYGFIAESITLMWYLLIVRYAVHVPLWVGFACTGTMLLSLHFIPPRMYTSMNIYKAALLGCAQGIALLPGISRFACTYSMCSWMGLRPERALQWSMLVQWPLIFVAALYGTYMLESVCGVELLHLIGCLSMLGATIIAYAFVYGMYTLVLNNNVWLWSLYMCIPTALAWYFNL